MIENVSARQKEWRIFFMKKWKLGALLLTAALLAAGCSKAEKQETAPEPEQPDYYVGVEADNAPYYSTDENGTVSGFYVDLMNTLSERGGFTYEFKTMSPAEYKAAGADPTDENNGTSSQPGHLFLGTMEPEAGDNCAASHYIAFSSIASLRLFPEGHPCSRHTRTFRHSDLLFSDSCFSDLLFPDSCFSDLLFSDLYFSDLQSFLLQCVVLFHYCSGSFLFCSLLIIFKLIRQNSGFTFNILGHA